MQQRAGPEWIAEKIRDSTQALEVDFLGRQKIDQHTGRLVGP